MYVICLHSQMLLPLFVIPIAIIELLTPLYSVCVCKEKFLLEVHQIWIYFNRN